MKEFSIKISKEREGDRHVYSATFLHGQKNAK